jgi:hypothetical protein
MIAAAALEIRAELSKHVRSVINGKGDFTLSGGATNIAAR